MSEAAPDPYVPGWCPCGQWIDADYMCGDENCGGMCDDTHGVCDSDQYLCGDEEDE